MSPSDSEPAALICPECDYNLTGAPGDRCPWCGWTIDVHALIERAGASFRARRFTTIVAAWLFGVGSLLAATVLALRGSGLTIQDALTVLAVALSGAGHLCIAALAMGTPVTRWPIRHPEAASIVRGLVWTAVLAGLAGASQALQVPPGARGGEGIVMSGVLEFVLRFWFFTLPAWTLLVLRLVSFRSTGPRPHGIAGPARVASEKPDVHPPFVVESSGELAPDQVTQEWSDEPRPTTPVIEEAIAATWQRERATAERRGGLLFDGPLVRMVRARGASSGLHLTLGPTCYRDFLGTNVHGGELVVAEMPAAFANPLGISAALVTADGYLALGRRGSRVANHAGALHPFGGMVEAADRGATGHCDLFGALVRELAEETDIAPDDVVGLRLVALVRDRALRQPELIFCAAVRCGRDRLRVSVGPTRAEGEHDGVEFVHDDPETVLAFLQRAIGVTPVAQAAILMHGKREWGREWYEQSCYALYGDVPPRVANGG